MAGAGKQPAELQHAAPPDLRRAHRRRRAGDHLIDRLELLVQPQLLVHPLQDVRAQRGQAALCLVAVEPKHVQGVEGVSERVGHGVRCLEDPALVAELRERRIPLEVCPTSNVRTGVVAGLAAHPLPRLIQEGLVVTLNSDDPPMFGTSLRDEYLAAARVLGLSPVGLRDLARSAARAAFLPWAEAQALVAEIDTVPLPTAGR
jgi:adenosine deaminase